MQAIKHCQASIWPHPCQLTSAAATLSVLLQGVLHCWLCCLLQVDSPPDLLHAQQQYYAEPFAAAEPHMEVSSATATEAKPGMLMDVPTGPHARRQLLFTPPPQLAKAAKRRMLPEEYNVTWGLDMLDQGYLPLDSVYHYTYNGEPLTRSTICAAEECVPLQPTTYLFQQRQDVPCLGFHLTACKHAVTVTRLCRAAAATCLTGTGVHAYILDTGIRTTHEEFIDPVTQQTRAFHGFDALYNSNSSEDCHGHGSHVAAIVGGEQSVVCCSLSGHFSYHC